MNNLTQFDKSICVQGCINSYAKIFGEDIPDGFGAHGKPDWTPYENGNKGDECVEWWQDWDGEKYSSGYTGIINHPRYGKIGVICFQGTTPSHNKVGWKSNFDFELVNHIKKMNNDKGGLIVPYGNTDSKIRMHDGITQVYGMSRERVRDFAKWCYAKSYPIWIFGHSQGGGVTTAAFIDFHYMFHTEMRIPQDKMGFLTGYGAASPAIFNKEGCDSFNKRAAGNFYREHILGDPVTEVPGWTVGYWQVNRERAYTDLRNNLLVGPCHIFYYVTLGTLPSVMAWNHDPRKLLAAVEGRPIPVFKIDTSHDVEENTK